MLLANSLFFNKGKPVFSNGPRSLPNNPRDCTILDSWVFDNFILADALFAKALWNLETCLSANNNSCGTLVLLLELPIIFDERFKSYFRATFIPDFNLLSSELDNFTFRLLYWVILYWYCIRAKKIHNTLTVPWEKSKWFPDTRFLDSIWISSKINLFYCFLISTKCFLFAYNYCYHLTIFLETGIIQ